MTLKKSFILALSNIMFDKTRSLLTMLGIIIGVAAVIILVSLMNGMTGMITDTFSEIGITSITVSVTNRGGSRVVKEDKFYELYEENPDLIDGVSPNVTISGTVKSGNNSITSSATGVSEEYAHMKKLEIENGRFIQYHEVANNKKVCVIGTYIQQEFFGRGSALNQSIKINGDSYTVVGILKETASSESGSSDDVIYIPYTTALRASDSGRISSYTVNAKSDELVNATC